MSVDSTRVVYPLFQTEEGGSIPASTLQLIYEPCPRKYAAILNQRWHSRLPRVEWGTMLHAFHARHADTSYAVALWSNPVTNMLPTRWLELRRLAIAPDAPKNTASSFISWMVRYFRSNFKEADKLISYQDCEVHSGTIYKASGWEIGRTGRSGDWNHPSRFRPVKNGIETNRSEKIRWERDL